MAGWRGQRWALLALVGAAAFYFTANAAGLSLLPLDDCFYARKGVEMARRGALLTVTWNGEPTFQNPPLSFWILGRSFALLGENDLAARLPSALMGVGIVLVAWRIGRRAVGDAAALGGAALLLATPFFLQNGRRCMLEIPSTFWQTVALLVFVEAGLAKSPPARPSPWLAAVALPLGAALATKSVLGLLPAVVMAAAALLVPALRRLRRSPWLWLGLAGGVALGAVWPLHQGLAFGWDAVRAHFLGEVGRHAAGGAASGAAGDAAAGVAGGAAAVAGLAARAGGWLVGYPLILLRWFQPVALFGLAGAVVVAARLAAAWRRERRAGTGGENADGGFGGGALARALAGEPAGPLLLLIWLALPLALLGLAASRSARYAFPLVVPLALLSGWLGARLFPRWLAALARVAVPVLLAAAGAVLWLAPQALTRDLDAPFKRHGALVAQLLPPGTGVPLLGAYRWDLANPLLYYGQRAPDPAVATVADAVAAARRLPRAVLLCDQDALPQVRAACPEAVELARLRRWALVELGDAPREGP